ncbi:MarR family winged helix-turn-helix transcriptional regulator [Naasia aerilata]|uniref:MarR family winged helix-turn-helix transcriptional regulator n=1 Tax=Naasia aerilata TaxID=1162966 RepID=UPI002572FC84|nr:MarR family transcriptional regulator [Naasia aerilata]
MSDVETDADARAATAPAGGASSALARETAMAIMALMRSVDNYRYRAATDAQVSITELRALGRISIAGGLSPKELARTLDLTTGTVTALLDRLERAELVTRKAHERDRRMLTIQLTEKGLAKISEVIEDFSVRVGDTAADLPPETLVLARDFFLQLNEQLRADAASWRRAPDAPLL